MSLRLQVLTCVTTCSTVDYCTSDTCSQESSRSINDTARKSCAYVNMIIHTFASKAAASSMTPFPKHSSKDRNLSIQVMTIPPQHTHAHQHVCTYMHACMHACMNTYILEFVHACVHACMHAYIHPHIPVNPGHRPPFTRGQTCRGLGLESRVDFFDKPLGLVLCFALFPQYRAWCIVCTRGLPTGFRPTLRSPVILSWVTRGGLSENGERSNT